MGDQPGSTVLFSRNPDKHELILSGWLVKLGNGNFVLFGCSNPLQMYKKQNKFALKSIAKIDIYFISIVINKLVNGLLIGKEGSLYWKIRSCLISWIIPEV
jgi:hypothetical protein